MHVCAGMHACLCEGVCERVSGCLRACAQMGICGVVYVCVCVWAHARMRFNISHACTCESLVHVLKVHTQEIY